MGATTGTTEVPTQDQLPSPTLLSEASTLLLKDSTGQDIPFESLYTPTTTTPTHLLVFIRHFFCGFCEEYIRALASALPPTLLASHATTLTIIGCGDPVCIPDYKARTGCPYEIYADPKQQLYKKLGMVSALVAGQKTPEYSSKGLFSAVTGSIMTVIKSGSKGLKGGPAAQQGGEWLFENGELKWVHRMRNFGDHTEIKRLKEVLGISE